MLRTILRTNRARKQKTREQVQKMKEKAAKFSREVIGDDDKAQQFEDMSVEDYAEKKKVQLVNPSRRREIVEQALSHLPYHASAEDRVKALGCARDAVHVLEPDATELAILQAAGEAVAAIAAECERRQRKRLWLGRLSSILPWGISDDEETEARDIAALLLDSLPTSLSNSEVEDELRRKLRPLTKAVELRERKKDLVRYGVASVDGVLSQLYSENLIDWEERWDSEQASDLRETVEETLKDELSGDEDYSDVRERVPEIIEGELEIESEDED